MDDAGKVTAVGTQSRVFRNRPGIGYIGKIHEYIMSTDGSEFHFVDAVNELSIYHTGYGKIGHAQKVASGRNIKIIQKELEENPDSYRMLGYLGDEYYSADDLEKAEEAFRRSISLMPETEEIVDPIRTSMTFTKLLEILYAKYETPEDVFMEIYNKAVKRLPQEADFDYYAGKYFVRHNNCKAAEKHLKRALDQLEKYGTAFKSMFVSGDIRNAYEMLATCCFNNGNLADSINYCVILLKSDKYLMSALFLMLTAFSIDECSKRPGASSAEAVASFLGQNLYDFTTLKDRLFVMKGAMKAGYGNMVQVMRRTFSPEELQVVDQALAAEGSKG